MNTGLDDQGFDRLRAAVLDCQGRRSGRQVAAAADADRAPLVLDEVLEVPAPAEPRSLGETGRVVYQGVRGRLEARGVEWEEAHRLAARCAAGVLLELIGLDREEVVGRLGITPRTLERDRSLLRGFGRGVFDRDGDS